MAKNTKPKDSADYIVPLNMNGLTGRMLSMPSPKKREILLIYGHHASLERMFGVAEALSQYGHVTMPDLPGFGGMQSFYKIGLSPTLDNFADYLAAFIKLRYRGKRVSIFAMSFGFAVVTKMLQRYPELCKKVDLLVSIVGFVHKEDFKFKRRNFVLMRSVAWFFSGRFTAWFGRYIVLRPTFIRWAYLAVAEKHTKLKDADIEEREKRINFEIGLWHKNDVRTHMKTTQAMFKLDLCNRQVKLPVYHISVEPDRYFDNNVVEQHMRVIFSDFTGAKTKMSGHAPTVIATASEAAMFIPIKIRKLLLQP